MDIPRDIGVIRAHDPARRGYRSSHPPAMPPAWVPVKPPRGTAITLPDELLGHLTTLKPATSLALPVRGFL